MGVFGNYFLNEDIAEDFSKVTMGQWKDMTDIFKDALCKIGGLGLGCFTFNMLTAALSKALTEIESKE